MFLPQAETYQLNHSNALVAFDFRGFIWNVRGEATATPRLNLRDTLSCLEKNLNVTV